MRIGLRSALMGALILAPASALAWPWPEPALPQVEAEMIALDYGVATIVDIDATIDGDWDIEGTDFSGREIELEIDGVTGAIEHSETEED